MLVDLLPLKNNMMEVISLQEELSFSPEQLATSDLLDLKQVTVTGTITKQLLDRFSLELQIEGTMICPCAVTLKPVSYPFSITVSGDLLNFLQEIDENVKKIENTIDLFPIIWENILMEIPMRVVSDDVDQLHLEGDGWKVITNPEEQVNENPELAKLRELLKEKEV